MKLCVFCFITSKGHWVNSIVPGSILFLKFFKFSIALGVAWEFQFDKGLFCGVSIFQTSHCMLHPVECIYNVYGKKFHTWEIDNQTSGFIYWFSSKFFNLWLSLHLLSLFKRINLIRSQKFFKLIKFSVKFLMKESSWRQRLFRKC